MAVPLLRAGDEPRDRGRLIATRLEVGEHFKRGHETRSGGRNA